MTAYSKVLLILCKATIQSKVLSKGKENRNRMQFGDNEWSYGGMKKRPPRKKAGRLEGCEVRQSHSGKVRKDD